MIKIRYYNRKGSEIQCVVEKEANEILQSAWWKGSCVFDETLDKIIHEREVLIDEHQYAIVPAIAGG